MHQKEEKRRQGKGTEEQTKRELRTTGGILIELLNKNKNQFPVRQALHTTFTSLVGNIQVSCITSTNNTECQKSNYISFCLNSKTRRCHNIFSEVGWALKITNLKLQESREKATACINPPPQTPPPSFKQRWPILPFQGRFYTLSINEPSKLSKKLQNLKCWPRPHPGQLHTCPTPPLPRPPLSLHPLHLPKHT